MDNFEQNQPPYNQQQSVFNNYNNNFNGNQPLPNATASLVLGILSIVVCYLGFIMGIIGLVLAAKDASLYNSNPQQFSKGSYNNSKAGKICSIVGVCIWGITFFGIIINILAGRGYRGY